jgi:hypothetical protein
LIVSCNELLPSTALTRTTAAAAATTEIEEEKTRLVGKKKTS